MRDSADSGSAVLELVALLTLLLLPLGFLLRGFASFSDQLLVEQIARHAARYLVLTGNYQNSEVARNVATEIARDWGSSEIPSLTLTCENFCQPGTYLNLEVRIASGHAIQTMAIEK